MAFAGLDVGTSKSKLLVYDLDGSILFRASQGYAESGGDGQRELDPGIVIESVKKLLKKAGEHCPEPIEALAVAGLGESVVCLNGHGEPLAYSMLTGDCRGAWETKEIRRRLGAEKVFTITGLPPNELYGLPKYIWLDRHTDAVKEAQFILFYEDYVAFMLTGERMVSYSSAARSMAFNIHQNVWQEELLSLAGIRASQLSAPAAAGTVIGVIRPETAGELHLNPKMKVVVGGHDQSMAALGGGLILPGMGECGMGTCEFLFALLPKEEIAPGHISFMLQNDFTCIPYIHSDTWLTSLEVTTCGALKNWARDTVFSGIRAECERHEEEFYRHMDAAAAGVDTDVLILPQFGSSGNPDLSMNAGGTIAGLTIHTRPEELYRAVLEGMAFQMLLSWERLQKLGVRLDCITATGGGAVSELALRLRADIFNKKVRSLKNNESGTAGCMIAAAVGLGAYSSFEEGIKHIVKTEKEFFPDERRQEYYRGKFRRYRQLYERMHDFK